ncbi:MAG: hypothetical protein COZ32_06300, partial [Nitrospirae bacterium CG_4_10_14_3_um_filter_53_41]
KKRMKRRRRTQGRSRLQAGGIGCYPSGEGSHKKRIISKRVGENIRGQGVKDSRGQVKCFSRT